MFYVKGMDSSELRDLAYAVQVHKCRLLEMDDNKIEQEPPSVGRYAFHPVTNFRRVPEWYNDEDFIMPAVPMDASIPAHLRTGFFFNFNVPKRAAVTLAVLRTNPRTGEVVDPRSYSPFLRFANQAGGQNFYTPGSWNNPPWIDGARLSAGIIQQMFFTDWATGLSIDSYTLPPELQGSDSIMIQFWECLIPEPPPQSNYRGMGLESTSRSVKSLGVALGGKMAQKVIDIPEYDQEGQRLWNNRAWALGPAVVIRMCPVSLFEEMQGFSNQGRPQPQAPQNNWPANKGYPSPSQMKGKLPF